MTNKDLQVKENEIIVSRYNEAVEEFIGTYGQKPTRLRTCNAVVYESASYYFLVSYSTMVAFIEKHTDTLFDVLRYVYGYTATSAQHISKFKHDFGQDKWGVHSEFCYREV